LLAQKDIEVTGFAFNRTNNSSYNGSSLQAKMEALYIASGSVMKAIAVRSDLSSHDKTVATPYTQVMAGSQTANIFFAMTVKDTEKMGSQRYMYASNWWTRSPMDSGSVYIVNTSGGGYTGNSPANAPQGIVPAVWVRVA
jgi:hypothetical protein